MAAYAGPMVSGILNVALSNFAKEYRNNALVAELLAPRVAVQRQMFQYLIFDRANQRLTQQTLRAPGARPQTIRRSWSTNPYNCKSHALSAEIPYETEAYALGMNFSLKQKATEGLIQLINLDREVYLANLLATAATNTTPLSGTSCWDSYVKGGANYDINGFSANGNWVGANPIAVVDQLKQEIRQAGVSATHMVVSDPVHAALRNHPALIDRFKYTNVSGFLTPAQLSSLFELEYVMASAVNLDKNDNASFVWGQNVVIAHVENVSSMEDVSSCKTFSWTDAPDTTDGYGVIEFPDPMRDSKKDWVSTDWYWDMQITAQETIAVLTGVVAAPTMVAIPAPVEG
jgi:hypothetical protein